MNTALKQTQNNVVYLYTSKVSCGFPSPADDYIENPLDLNEHLISKPAATFFVRAKGDSMINCGIYDGDLIIIDRSLDPQSGNVVLASINGEFTLKRFINNSEGAYLQPENSKYRPIDINENSDFQIFGVAIHSVHKLL